ncbi:MAG: hypothetical protein M2R45_01068 [Verrucomicrobia subdivision 3 bacterium]|nr:hypothetical protein [Limisphaerales bacterium]MCS1414178.1 hypothetical protein [Limisphaerales bacterium]
MSTKETRKTANLVLSGLLVLVIHIVTVEAVSRRLACVSGFFEVLVEVGIRG